MHQFGFKGFWRSGQIRTFNDWSRTRYFSSPWRSNGVCWFDQRGSAISGKSDEEIRERLAQFYTDLNVDGSFISLGDNTWGLRAWYPFESIDEATVGENEEDEEDDRPKKKRRKVNAFLADTDDDDDVIDYDNDDPEDEDLDTDDDTDSEDDYDDDTDDFSDDDDDLDDGIEGQLSELHDEEDEDEDDE